MSLTSDQDAKIGSDIFCEFLEVAVHSILYLRDLYPPNVFEKRKKYNVPVHMCIHPEVSQYVTQVVTSLHRMKQESHINQVSFVILSKERTSLERFVFEIGKPESATGSDSHLFHIEQSLREFLLKLNVTGAVLKPLPQDCTWTVQVETKESTADKVHDTQMVQGFPWVTAEERETTITDSNIVPLKAVVSDYMKLQMYVEECNQKQN